MRGAGIEVTGRDVLKTAPRGYPKDHPRIEWLRHKSLIAWREWTAGAWLGTAKAKSRIVDFLHEARPLQDWLDTHVGDSESRTPGAADSLEESPDVGRGRVQA